jgi:hypothetical protein
MGLSPVNRLAAISISMLATSSPAFGAEVSGRVLLDSRPFVGKLVLQDGTEINIVNGEYKIFVPAGVYRVVFDNGRKFSATLTSSTIPVNQNIDLDSKH